MKNLIKLEKNRKQKKTLNILFIINMAFFFQILDFFLKMLVFLSWFYLFDCPDECEFNECVFFYAAFICLFVVFYSMKRKQFDSSFSIC